MDKTEEMNQFLHSEDACKWIQDEICKLHSFIEKETGITLTDGGEISPNLPLVLNKPQWERIIRIFFKREKED